MRYGSVCSGIEAASAAWGFLGWKACWFAEIEAFPSAVLAHHYPDVPNLGDMTRIADLIELGLVEAPDVLVGGTPCQSFSVAGLRAGLSDARGGLTLAFVELANAIDRSRQETGDDPALVVWENVPGVLSSKDNAFGCFLAGIVGEDQPLVPAGKRWSNAGAVYGPQRAAAWRILDAQYFGLAQRRRRVFVVASARHNFDPATVLFEFEGVRRDFAPRRETRKDVAPTISACPTGRGGLGTDFDLDGGLVAPTLKRDYGKGYGDGEMSAGGLVQSGVEVAPTLRAGGNQTGGDRPYGTDVDTADSLIVARWPADIALTLNAHFGNKQGLEDQHALNGAGLFVPHAPAVAFAIQERAVSENPDNGPQGKGWQADAAFTLEARNKTQAVAFDLRGRDGGAMPEGAHDTANIRAASGGSSRSYVAFAQNQRDELRTMPVAGALASQPGMKQQTYVAVPDVAGTMTALNESGGWSNSADHAAAGYMVPTAASAVRRLTPEECEALQGFPRKYTLIPYRNKPAADGPRYKALGNSMAVPVMRWIGRRIQMMLGVRPLWDELVG